jgi:hypothetical protein
LPGAAYKRPSLTVFGGGVCIRLGDGGAQGVDQPHLTTRIR